MSKKYIFLDLDGTIIDHKSNSVPKSTKDTIKRLQENGHEIIISTGRPPSLFYDIDKELNIDSYIASNGRIVVYKGKMILNQAIDKDVVQNLVDVAVKEEIDLGKNHSGKIYNHESISTVSLKFSSWYSDWE